MGMPETDMFGKPWPTNPMQDTLQKNLGGKRDQWSGKGDVTASGHFGRMEGFDQKNFADPSMQTAKYQAGRMFSRFDPNDPGALTNLLNDAEFKGVFGNAKGVGPDKIDFGDGRPVDVIRGHGAPGAGWSWQTQDDAPVIGATRPGVSNTLPIVGQQSDLMAQILESLQGQQDIDPQMLLQQQLAR